MKTTGRLVILICVLSMLALVSGTVFAAPTVPGAVYGDSQASGVNKPVVQIQQELQQAGIKDVKPTDWSAGSITVVVQAGLLKPAGDGSFHPEANVKADEGVAVFAKVLGIAAKTDDAATAAQKMKDAGLVSTTPTADKDMTRIEVARMLATALGVTPKANVTTANYPFMDMYKVRTNDDLGILAALYDLGIFKGYPEDNGGVTFRPDAILTRAQIAILIDRILGAQGH